MTYTEPTLLTEALAQHCLELFLVGEPPWFFDVKAEFDEPQKVMQAFDILVYPYWKTHHDPAFPEAFANALFSMLMMYPDRNRAIYIAHDWIWYYRYCLNKKRLNPEGLYADLFEVDLTSVAALLKSLLESNKEELIKDTRWAGEPRNSQQGMWAPLLRSSKNVRDNLRGPDFVPDNA